MEIDTDGAIQNDQKVMKQGATQNSKSVKRVKKSDVVGTRKTEGKQPSRSRTATHAEAGDMSRNTTAERTVTRVAVSSSRYARG